MKGVYTPLIEGAAIACLKRSRTGLWWQASRQENPRVKKMLTLARKTTLRGQPGVIYEH